MKTTLFMFEMGRNLPDAHRAMSASIRGDILVLVPKVLYFCGAPVWNLECVTQGLWPTGAWRGGESRTRIGKTVDCVRKL